MSGFTDAGLIIKTQSEIIDDQKADARSLIGQNVATSSEPIIGQILGVTSGSAAELWEVFALLESGQNPATAVGQQLDNIAAQYGISRLSGTKSRSVVQFVFDPGATLDAGKQITNFEGTVLFEVPETVTSVAGGTVSIELESVDFGPINAASGTLTLFKQSAPTGITIVGNASDAFLGTAAETDAEFRRNFYSRIAARGSATPGSIEGALGAIDGIECAFVFENTLGISSEGLDCGQIEVVIFDKSGTVDPNVIAQTIWDKHPIGVGFAGPLSGTATNKAGTPVTVNYSTVLPLDVYFEVDVQYKATAPTNADQLVREAIANNANLLFSCGDDITPTELYCFVWEFPWIQNVTRIAVGFNTISMSEDLLEIGPREVGIFDTARVVVNP